MSARLGWSGLLSRGERGFEERLSWRSSGAILDALAVVSGLDDLAVMHKAVEQRGRQLHIGVRKRPRVLR